MKNEPWGKIDMRNWEKVPHLRGRRASELDVAKGIAVFYIPESHNSEPYELVKFPSCAIFREEGNGPEMPVVVIQTEKTDQSVLIGYRLIIGGNGVCDIKEIELLDGPDSRFY